MPELNDNVNVPGLTDLIASFGYMPTFHDAEVLSVSLDPSRESRVVVHTFEITNEVVKDGSLVCRKHLVVTFIIKGLLQASVQEFNKQNVLSGLFLIQTDSSVEITLEAANGAYGTIEAESVSIELWHRAFRKAVPVSAGRVIGTVAVDVCGPERESPQPVEMMAGVALAMKVGPAGNGWTRRDTRLGSSARVVTSTIFRH